MRKTMLDYIRESSIMMEENSKDRKRLTEQLVREYVGHQYENIWIVASGSSYNGAACARMFIQNLLEIQVKLISPFQFVHAEHHVPENDMVIAVSQSGYSKNTMEALDTMRSIGRKAIALTGDLDSDIKDKADLLLDFGVGTETVGYVTKGVSALALYLILFAVEAAREKTGISEKALTEFDREIAKVIEAHNYVQNNFNGFFDQHIDLFTSMQNAYVCACGANLGTAMEAALKAGETIQIPSAGYEVEEYIHGPNLQLTPNYTVFFVDGGCASERVFEIFKNTRIVTKKSILLTNCRKFEGEGIFYVPFDGQEDLTPLCFLPFFQMMSYEVTERLHKWEKHPLQLLMKEKVAAKTDNYINSPLKRDMPG